MLRAVLARHRLLPVLALLLTARAVAAPSLPDAVLEAHRAAEAGRFDGAGPPLARAHARWLRSRQAIRRGDADAARADVEALGFVTRWAVVGPLPFPGVGDLDTRLAPEDTAARGPFDGREHPVDWHGVGDAARFGLLDLGAVSHNAAPGVVMARSAFTLEAPARVVLRVAASAPYRLRVDGERRAGGGRRPARFDQDAWLFDLGAGTHSLLLKVGVSAEPAVVGVRLTTPEGEPLAFRPADPAAMSDAAPPPPGPPVAIADPLASAEAAAAAAPKSADAAIRYARLLDVFRPDDREVDRRPEAWIRAAALAPKDVDVLIDQAAALTRERDRRRQLLERAVALAPKSARALAALARHQDERDLDRAARTLWARVEAVEPGHPEAALSTLAPLERLGLGGAVRARLAQTFERHPKSVEVARRYADALTAADRLGEAEAVLRRALEVHAEDPGLWDRLLSVLERRRDTEAIVAARAARRRVEPFAAESRAADARALFGAGRRPEALALLDEATAVAPERPELWEAQGDLRHRAGETAAAVAAWERALALEPQRAAVARYLAFLDPARRELSDRARRDARAAALAVEPGSGRGAGAWYLFDTTAVDVHPNGLRREFRQYAIRLEDAALAEGLRHQTVALTPAWQRLRVLAAEVVRPDGSVAEARRRWAERPFGKVGGVYSDYEVNVLAFDDLGPGDTLHVAYVVEDVSRQNVLGEFFGHLSPAQDRYPKAEWSLWVRMPDDRPLQFGGAGLGEPARERVDGRPLYRWTARDLPGRVTEPDAPAVVESGALVSLSTFRAWDDVARWYAGLIADQGALDDELRGFARAVAAEALGSDRLPGDDREAVRKVVGALFDRVVADTRYVGIEFGVHGFRPYTASQVFRRGYGDCKDKANLLGTLLRAVGVESEVVLVRTRDLGRPPTEPPSPWLFNHAILYVPSLDRYYDATTDFGGPDELPTGDQGALALRVGRDGKGRLVTLPTEPAEINAWRVTSTLRLMGGGDALLVQQERAGGAGAAMVRALLQDPIVARRRLEQMLGAQHPGASVLDLADAETRRDRPAGMAVTVRLPGFARTTDDGLATVPISPFPLRMVHRYAQASVRTADLVAPFPWSHRVDLTVEAPEGAEFEPPRDVDLSGPFGRYRRTARRAPGGWIVEREAALTVTRVAAADYPAFRAFCEAIDAAEADRGRLRPVTARGEAP